MTSWLRIRGDELQVRRVSRGTPAHLMVNYPGREYKMYAADTPDEDILNSFYPGEPKEIIRFRTHILAGPLPNGRHDGNIID